MPSFTERELKLVRLMLDPSAPPGEAEAAMRKLLVSLRSRGVDGYNEMFTQAGLTVPAPPDPFAADTHAPPQPQYQRPPQPSYSQAPPPYSKAAGMGWPFSLVMAFGKHHGKYLGDLPSDYLLWCIDKFDPNERGSLIEAMKIILAFRAEQIRKGNFNA